MMNTRPKMLKVVILGESGYVTLASSTISTDQKIVAGTWNIQSNHKSAVLYIFTDVLSHKSLSANTACAAFTVAVVALASAKRHSWKDILNIDLVINIRLPSVQISLQKMSSSMMLQSTCKFGILQARNDTNLWAPLFIVAQMHAYSFTIWPICAHSTPSILGEMSSSSRQPHEIPTPSLLLSWGTKSMSSIVHAP